MLSHYTQCIDSSICVVRAVHTTPKCALDLSYVHFVKTHKLEKTRSPSLVRACAHSDSLVMIQFENFF